MFQGKGDWGLKLEQLEKSNRLFETYGFSLTPIQNKILGLYLADGLQITEIAEILGTTKQAVSKSVANAHKKLENIENNLQFLAFQDTIKSRVQSFCEMAERGDWKSLLVALQKLNKEL